MVDSHHLVAWGHGCCGAGCQCGVAKGAGKGG